VAHALDVDTVASVTGTVVADGAGVGASGAGRGPGAMITSSADRNVVRLFGLGLPWASKKSARSDIYVYHFPVSCVIALSQTIVPKVCQSGYLHQRIRSFISIHTNYDTS